MQLLDPPIQLAAATGSAASTAASMVLAEYSLAFLGVPLPTVLAGFGGALFSLSVMPRLSLQRAAMTVLGNTMAAAYTTRLAMHVLGIPEGHYLGAAFLIGALAQFGLTLATEWLRNRYGAKP